MSQRPKILLFDIETAPLIAYTWKLYYEVQSMDFVKDDWYILCWAAKWLGEKEVMSAGVYGKKRCDKKVVKPLWKLFNEADIVIAHNAVKFDCKKANARFIANGLKPPSPPKVIDTLKIARKHFAFTSNRLNDLGIFLDVGKKVPTGGFQLWKDCMAGQRKAWDTMVKYCKGDVLLLEKVYEKLRPYASTHPSMGVYDGTQRCNCGSMNFQKRGFEVTKRCKYQRLQCQDCGSWTRGDRIKR